MKLSKLFSATLLSTLLASSADAAWSCKNGSKTQDPTQSASQSSDDLSVFFEADYLFWLPHQENLFYGSQATTQNPFQSEGQGGPGAINAVLKEPSFKLASGVRLGLGGYTSGGWDVGARAAYLYADASSRAAGDGNSSFVGPAFLPLILGTALKANCNWQLNTWIFDLTFGKEYHLTKRVTIHPFIGARGAIINQKLRAKYHSVFFFSSNETRFANTVASAKNDFWGVGPRTGLDINLFMSKNWTFLGGLSGSLLISQYKVKFAGDGFVSDSESGLDPLTVSMRDKRNICRANMDAYFGLGWENEYNQGRNRFTIALLAEGSYWWGINQLAELDLTFETDGGDQGSDNLSLIFQKRHGDLSFIGGTVHFRFDF